MRRRLGARVIDVRLAGVAERGGLAIAGPAGVVVVAGVVVAEGELIPKTEESYNHTARPCRVGPDNKVYIQLGQPYNVPPKEKLDMYRKLRRPQRSHASF